MARPQKNIRHVSQLLAVYVGVGALTLLLLFPFLWMLSTSLKPSEAIFSSPSQWLPWPPTFEHYRALWLDTDFVRFFINSLVVAGGTTLISVVISVLAGYAISRFRFRGDRLFSMGLIVIQMFPPVLLVIPIFIMMIALRLTNTYASLIITYSAFAVSFCTWMLKGYFASIPREIEEMGLVDGCTRLQALWKIIVPVSVPGIVAVALFVFIFAWQEYMFALTFMQTTPMRTLPVGLSLMIGFREVMWGPLMAGAVLVTLPVVIVFMYFQKYLVYGLTLGAVKE
jgi:multiple sugar transport system permease protein